MVVVMLGFGIIIPIMPFYVESFGAGGTQLGMLMATFSIMQFLFAPLWGSLSDRYGRKRILILGALGNAVSHLIFGFAGNLEMMFFARALGGILSSATIPTAMAYISDSTSERDRGAGMGLIGAAMGMGMVLGPGIGGWLGGKALTTPFFLASGLSFLAALLILAILPESLPQEKRTQPGGKLRGVNLGAMGQALLGPMSFLFILAFLVNFGLANFEGIFGLYAKHRYEYGPEQVGTILTMIGLISVVIQGFLTGPATRKFGEVVVIRLSLAASALGFAIMLLAESFPAVLATVAFFIFSNTMLRPSMSSLISKRAQGGQGMALGLSSGFESLGRVVGPLWAGALFDVNLGLPYASAAVIMLVGCIFSLFWLKNSPQSMPLTRIEDLTGEE